MIGRNLAGVGRNLLGGEIAANDHNVSSRRQTVLAIDAAIIGPALTTAVLPPHWIAFSVARHYRADLRADHRFALSGRHPARDHSSADHRDHGLVADAVIIPF